MRRRPGVFGGLGTYHPQVRRTGYSIRTHRSGDAAQNVFLQATALGFGTVVVGAFDDRAVMSLLEHDAGERPLYLMPLGVSR